MKHLLPLQLLISLLIFGSCTIQKRRYNTGFHIEWRNKLKSDSGNQNQSDNYSHQNSNVENQIFIQHSDSPVDSVVFTENTIHQPIDKIERQSASQEQKELVSKPKERKQVKFESVFKQKIKEKKAVNGNEFSNGERLFVAVFTFLLTLYPIAVFVMAGRGGAFRTSLTLTILGIVLSALLVILFWMTNIQALALTLLFAVCVILELIAFIQALVVIINYGSGKKTRAAKKS